MVETKWRHFINLHKILTPFVVYGLMLHYGSFGHGAWLYLGMHGTYCMCWLLKDLWYPDRSFQQPLSLVWCIAGFIGMLAYWVAPYMVIKSHYAPSGQTVFGSTVFFTFGMFFHYGSDAQKHFTLKAKKGLITDGFFSLTRNPNYLGEILTYVGFMLLAGSPYPFLGLAAVFVFLFYPNMKRKDASMARHEGFKEYKERTGLLIPKLW